MRARFGICARAAVLMTSLAPVDAEWTPVAFEYPRFAPCESHFSTLKPIPYRPFKWGDYQ